MRAKVATALIVLAVLGGLSALEQVAVRRVTGGALEGTRAIHGLIRGGAFAAAAEQVRTLDETWDRQARLLEMFVDHRATDDVRFAFSRLLAAIEGEDREAALVCVSELEGGIEHVRERQELLLQNVL